MVTPGVEAVVTYWLQGVGSAASFDLTVTTDNGAQAGVQHDGLGRTTFTFTPTVRTDFDANVAVTAAPAPGAPLRQSVSQNGAIVECRADPAAPPLNASGGGFTDVVVATLKKDDDFDDASMLRPKPALGG
jgi:hypothetical protein